MELKTNKGLDIKYAIIQSFYFMAYCSMMGFASVFLLNKGFSNGEIGIVLSLSSIAAVVAQPILASFIDKNQKISMQTIVSIAVIIVIGISAVLYFMKDPSIILLAMVILIFTIFATLQPLMNSLAFSFEKRGYQINFGLARGIGSVAYAFTSMVLGYVLEKNNPDVLPLFYIAFSIGVLLIVRTFRVPKDALKVELEVEDEQVQQLSLGQFVSKYKMFMLFLVGVVCIFFDHTIINNFFIQVMNNVGGSSSDMGNAIFLAAMLELPTMALFVKMKERIDCSMLLKISGIFFTLKHIITFFASSVTLIYVAQVLQIAAYALFIPASVYYVTQLVEKGDLVKGQALVTGAITLSSVFASFLGGIMLDSVGANTMLLIGMIVSVVGTLILFFSIEKV